MRWNDLAKSFAPEVISHVRNNLVAAASEFLQCEDADAHIETSSCSATDVENYFGFSQSSSESKRATNSTVDLIILNDLSDCDCSLSLFSGHYFVNLRFV